MNCKLVECVCLEKERRLGVGEVSERKETLSVAYRE